MLELEEIVYIDGIKDYLDKCKDIVLSYEETILFGSARGGERVYEFLCEWQLQERVRYVVDNDKMKQGKQFHGIPIISTEEMVEFLKKHDNIGILIASGSAHIIMEQLRGMEVEEKIMHPFAFTMLQTSPTPFEYFIDRKDIIERVFGILADEKSKDVFISLINFKMTMDSIWLKDVADNEHDQYFDEVMGLTEHESFVDCGAYIGDTLDEYNQRMKGKWKNYYLFEADSDVFEEMKRNVLRQGYGKCELYNVGCWDKKEVLHFQQTGSGSSQIADEAYDTKIEADALDNVLSGKEVSIIKMDIEGAEQKALKGAESIIREQHPKLAISNYHSMDDFLDIPILLQGYHDDYKIYMRHYRSLTDSETICYAV